MTPVGDKHPETLDQQLVDAIASRALGESMDAHARAASTAFVYLYMKLARGEERFVTVPNYIKSCVLTIG